MTRKVLDITLPIRPDMTTFPGNPAVELENWQSQATGAESSVSRLSIGTHTGTHVDPPSHVLQGAASVEQLDLNVLIGRAQVVDLTSVESSIMPADLAGKLMPGVERVLLKTRNSGSLHAGAAFNAGYVSLSTEAAAMLADAQVKLVAIDALSIESYKNPGRPTHRALLHAGVVVVEGVDLSEAGEGMYTLVCLPLRIVGADGSPARAVLIPEND